MAQSIFNGPAEAGDTSLTFVGRNVSQMSIQAAVVGTGVVAAVVTMEGSNNNVDWTPIVELNPQGADRAVDGGMALTNWEYLRARVVSITGTDIVCSMLTKGFAYGA